MESNTVAVDGTAGTSDEGVAPVPVDPVPPKVALDPELKFVPVEVDPEPLPLEFDVVVVPVEVFEESRLDGEDGMAEPPPQAARRQNTPHTIASKGSFLIFLQRAGETVD